MLMSHYNTALLQEVNETFDDNTNETKMNSSSDYKVASHHQLDHMHIAYRGFLLHTKSNPQNNAAKT